MSKLREMVARYKDLYHCIKGLRAWDRNRVMIIAVHHFRNGGCSVFHPNNTPVEFHMRDIMQTRAKAIPVGTTRYYYFIDRNDVFHFDLKIDMENEVAIASALMWKGLDYSRMVTDVIAVDEIRRIVSTIPLVRTIEIHDYNLSYKAARVLKLSNLTNTVRIETGRTN